MKRLIALLLFTAHAYAQTTPLATDDPYIARHKRWMDSARTAQAIRRKEIEAYNRAHPVKKRPVKSKSR